MHLLQVCFWDNQIGGSEALRASANRPSRKISKWLFILLLNSPLLSIPIVFSGLKVFLGKDSGHFGTMVLDLFPKCYPDFFVPKPLRLPQNLLQGLGKWQHFSRNSSLAGYAIAATEDSD
jgi:hypothetical protein